MTIFKDLPFQGTSFSPETLAVMTRVFEDAVDTLPFPVAAGRVQALARHIVEIAAEGEDDAERLKARALAALAASGRDDR
jgi:predicted TIM-barrel enzyme